MKTFIYFSQGEWRTFQAEEIPVKPIITDIFKSDMSLAARSRIYESEIAALKANSVKVGNPEIIPIFPKLPINGIVIPKNFKEGEIYQWPGTVEVKEELEYPIDHTSYPPYIEVAILKLPQ